METGVLKQTKTGLFLWEVSATDLFQPDELLLIRDAHVDDVVDFALSEKRNIKPSSTILELVHHGNYQKAALVLKQITCTSEESFDEILEGCSLELILLLENADLRRLPKNADETRRYFDLR